MPAIQTPQGPPQLPSLPQGGAQAPQIGGNGFNPDQNPFESILNQPPSSPVSPTAPVSPEELPTELQPGETGDNSKPLLSAIHNLHNYISLSTSDAAEIRVVRNLISALTQLLLADQDRSLRGENEPPPEVPEAPAAPKPAAPAAPVAPAGPTA